MEQQQWNENVILVDADYIDRVAFDLIVNFERMIGRRIPQADLCKWLDCICLDGGLRPGGNAVQVFFLHSGEKERLEHFCPQGFADDLSGKAFRDTLGEFALQSYATAPVVSLEDFFVESLETVLLATAVKRVMVVGDMESYGKRLRSKVTQAEGKEVTLFSMVPETLRGCYTELLGYSLMAALGIRGEELA